MVFVSRILLDQLSARRGTAAEQLISSSPSMLADVHSVASSTSTGSR